MRFPTSVRRSRRTLPLHVVPPLVVATALAVCAAVLSPGAGLAVLLVASAALVAAAVLGMRAHWRAELTAVPATAAAEPLPAPLPAPLEEVPDDLLALQLHGLQECTTDKVNRALADGRRDLAVELSDAYADEALRAITTAGLPPATPRL